MPTGIIVLIIGIVVGAVLGWVFMGDPFAGGAAGFAIAVVYLLVASWLDRREDKGT